MNLPDKYRPKRIEDFYQGRDGAPIPDIEALLSQRSSIPILLSGGSGEGKTSTSRRISATIECTGSAPPCGTCDNCKAIFSGGTRPFCFAREINAAREDVVEQVSNILQRAVGQHRWIITLDELTRDSFHPTLLKLIEDADDAQFILIVSDFAAVPPQLQSRCARFKFLPPTPAQFMTWLRRILEAEKIGADDAAIDVLFEAVGGDARQTLIILQMLAGSSKQITSKRIKEHYRNLSSNVASS